MAIKHSIKFCLLILILALFDNSSKAQLTANFTGLPLSGCLPLVVKFTDHSTGNPVKWKWDLGNGTTSFFQNPSVTYFGSGQYSIKLTVYNALGDSSVIAKAQYISVNAAPTVAFSGSPLLGCFPLPVNFTDNSTAGSGVISQWQWDFGDGTSSTLQNPSHTYTATGNYNVSLKLTNSNGCTNILSKAQYVKISSGVHADFSNTSPSTCAYPATINFTNLSTGTGSLSYQWSFGDGGTSTLANPVHTYNAAGNYTVRLIVTNSFGCTDTITKANLLSIGIIKASFTCANTVCVNSPLIITNTSLPNTALAIWNFGDGTTSTLQSPTKIYTASGTYKIQLISNSGGCFDTLYKTITVLNKPLANFTAINTTSCQAPLTVSFTNKSTSAISYIWDFGDGTTATQFNTTHTYTANGVFSVTLISTNANGCSDTLKLTDLVKIIPPKVSINNLPFLGCAPLTYTFSSTVNSPDPVVSYKWDFGDGGTSTLQNPTHTFSVGTYTIKLVITTAGGCSDTATVIAGIVASVKPSSNFVANPRDVCAFTPINFTDLSKGLDTIGTTWHWIFGDGGTSTDKNPIYQYSDTGYFDVTLIVCNNRCCDTIKFLNYIHIKPPIAAFDIDFACFSKTRHFTDKSIGADEWNWNFGDGITSTQQNPVHTYAGTGIYTISLLVKNYTTGCQHTKTQDVNILSEKANFTASQTVICKNISVDFTDVGNNMGNIASYFWSFGDGGTGTNSSVSHIYTKAGKYTVQLIITDIFGCKDTLIKPLFISVNGPTANFTPSNLSACTTSEIIFSDNSVSDGLHPIVQWVWDYGDGTTETLSGPPFKHLYSANGVYTVSLKVVDSKGCIDTFTSTQSIIISKPTANFSATNTISCPNKLIVFSNSSTGTALNYAWNFGDGTTSTDSNPTHAYTADGFYTVSLLVTDQYGCVDNISRPQYIQILTPHANFTPSGTESTCPPFFVSFTNTSQNFASVNWDFGDGTSTITDNPTHFYNIPGIYFAKLTITSPGGCTDSKQQQITVGGPYGNFTYNPLNGCKPLKVNFVAHTNNNVTFLWDFNDGKTLPVLDSVISYTYTLPGKYLPKMILIDANCVVPITGSDTIFINGVVANFGFLHSTYCDSASITFSDSSISSDGITKYNWNFGDGSISSLQNPNHLYTTPGLYFPKLIVTTINGCMDTAQSPVPVKIVASPQANFTNTPNGCTPLNVDFSGKLIIPDTSAIKWQWNFGNGQISNQQNPSTQTYNTAGIYAVKLIATNSSGCQSSFNKTIEAYLVPTINAGVDTFVCKGASTILNATGAASYIWTPATGLSCSNCASPVASPNISTNYTVTGTTLHGCSNSTALKLNVQQPFVMLNSKDDTLCKGSRVKLFASGAAAYVWIPSTGLNNTTIATPIATPLSTTTYQVVGTDSKGCFSDTGFVTIKVFDFPIVTAGQNKTINVGQTTNLMPTISADVNKVLWTPTQSIISYQYPGITVKPRETTEYTVEVTNSGGCKATDRVTVFVICNGANVFVPNTFSPNGDGVNDVFYPRGSGLFSIKTLRIFNRWGQVVFEKNDFLPNNAQAGWDGTYKGVKLTPDVFVYTLDIVCDNSEILTLKGNVALLQ